MAVGKGKTTPFKQKNLKSLIRTQTYKTNCIFRKHRDNKRIDQCHYLFDITAGDAESKLTSPIIFLDAFKYKDRKNLYFQAIFIESDKSTYNQLEENIYNYTCKIKDKSEFERFEQNIHIFYGKSDIILKEVAESSNIGKFGIAYYDGNGFKQELWDLMVAFSENWSHLDLVMNISPIQIKKNIGAAKAGVFGFEKYTDNLSQLIKQIKKKDIYIRNNIQMSNSPYKHIMLFCTNFGDWKELENEHGFVKITTDEGKEIIKLHT